MMDLEHMANIWSDDLKGPMEPHRAAAAETLRQILEMENISKRDQAQLVVGSVASCILLANHVHVEGVVDRVERHDLKSMACNVKYIQFEKKGIEALADLLAQPGPLCAHAVFDQAVQCLDSELKTRCRLFMDVANFRGWIANPKFDYVRVLEYYLGCGEYVHSIKPKLQYFSWLLLKKAESAPTEALNHLQAYSREDTVQFVENSNLHRDFLLCASVINDPAVSTDRPEFLGVFAYVLSFLEHWKSIKNRKLAGERKSYAEVLDLFEKAFNWATDPQEIAALRKRIDEKVSEETSTLYEKRRSAEQSDSADKQPGQDPLDLLVKKGGAENKRACELTISDFKGIAFLLSTVSFLVFSLCSMASNHFCGGGDEYFLKSSVPHMVLSALMSMKGVSQMYSGHVSFNKKRSSVSILYLEDFLYLVVGFSLVSLLLHFTCTPGLQKYYIYVIQLILLVLSLVTNMADLVKQAYNLFMKKIDPLKGTELFILSLLEVAYLAFVYFCQLPSPQICDNPLLNRISGF
ncbi:uncharacterized protein NEMAJ01_1960 [Nematocida major]|uniref:uncharacterized protein n=1 Tax=Nematocida major TaxID=1912982 RepID=UPI002007F96A|nr:uncharacterized protein NEMAJ01_1960 [Nematocida major]KAH9387064.1 hypothetical protein NEMAJ01_1960 [Nematocida major]